MPVCVSQASESERVLTSLFSSPPGRTITEEERGVTHPFLLLPPHPSSHTSRTPHTTPPHTSHTHTPRIPHMTQRTLRTPHRSPHTSPRTTRSNTHRITSHIAYSHTSHTHTHRIPTHIAYPHASRTLTHRIPSHIACTPASHTHTPRIPTHITHPHTSLAHLTPHASHTHTHRTPTYIAYPDASHTLTHRTAAASRSANRVEMAPQRPPRGGALGEPKSPQVKVHIRCVLAFGRGDHFESTLRTP